MILAEDVAISFWAIGPSYRNYLKRNIKHLLRTSADVFKFTILTDAPEEFAEIKALTNKCLKILDLNEERKDCTWSFEYEVIPSEKTEAEYGREFRENLKNGKRFSYSLHRFAIPYFIKHNITKFFFVDPDVHFNFGGDGVSSLQEYLDKFFTVDDSASHLFGVRLSTTRQKVNDDYYRILCEQLQINGDWPDDKPYPQADGPFRFYNFASTQELQRFYDIWNAGVKITLDHEECWPAHGPVFINDEVLLGAIYSILHTNIYQTHHMSIYVLDRVDNRYFEPSIGGFEITDTYEEFLQVNKDILSNTQIPEPLKEFDWNL